MDAESRQAQADIARRMVVQRLASLQRAGVTHIGKGAPEEVARWSALLTFSDPSVEATPPSPPAASTPAPSDTTPASPKPAPAAVQTSLLATPQFSGADVGMKGATLEQRRDALHVIQAEVRDCTQCEELARTRTQTVFGVGNPMAELVFLGEAPGADEDRQGEPFVGAAGKLLNKMISAMTLSREEIYILNILKCRPPGNRNPEPGEARNCRGFLDRQLSILQPKYIVCLGSVAAQNLLDTTQSVGKLRGRFWRYGDAKVVVTYHPAYLLREESQKRKAWDDLKMLMKDMGIGPA